MEGNFNNLFNYKILYSKNRRKTIGFKIINDTFVLTSPKNISQNFLLSFIEKKKFWVIERIKKNKNKKSLINKDSILYLGKDIPMKIVESPLLVNGGYCEIVNDKFCVTISKGYTDDILNKIIKDWYKEQCFNLIKERVELYSTKYDLHYSKITIKEQKTVWGTCNQNNDLTFNLKIMMFQKDIIDYLVVHELSHTVYKNHSNKYWKFVEYMLPNYKELDYKLKNYKY